MISCVMDLFKSKYNYPEDVVVYNDRLELKVKRRTIYYNKILSLKIHSSETKTSINLVPMGSEVQSELTIYLNKDKVTIRLKPYQKGLIFKNKKGEKKFESILYFYDFLENQTFTHRWNRMVKILKKLPKNALLEYQDYRFLNNKKITKSGSYVAEYDPKKFNIYREYKKIIFEENTKGFKSFFKKKLEIDISQDEDVFLNLLKFATGLKFKNYNYRDFKLTW